MPNVSSFGTHTDNSVVQGTVTDRAMVIPDIPPQGLMSVGPRVTPHFVKPSLWSALTTYHFFDAVHDAAGASYVAIKPEVPAGTELTDEEYWFLWADPNSQFADLSELVKTFNGRIEQNAKDITTKAPINHASDKNIYGVGNGVNYGHTKLAVDDTPIASDANSGIAATPAYVSKLIRDNDDKTSVIIGDSQSTENFTESTGKSWWKYVCEQLNTTPKCYAKGGCGWTQPGYGKTFIGQLEDAVSDSSFKNDNVDYVFIAGGLNDSSDWASVSTTFDSKVKKTIEFAIENFQNAKIFICNVIPFKMIRTNDPVVYTSVNKVAANYPVSIIPAIYSTCAEDTYYGADNHLNAQGNKTLAQFVLGCINGIPATRKIILSNETTEGANSSNEIYVLCNGYTCTLFIDYYFKANSTLTTIKTNGNFCMLMNFDSTTICGSGNGIKYARLFRKNDSSTITAQLNENASWNVDVITIINTGVL